MPNEAAFTLFHTDMCHLCEQAQELIASLGIMYNTQDICESDVLAERYGTRIPVLMRQRDHAELNWPFDIAQLTQFIGA